MHLQRCLVLVATAYIAFTVARPFPKVNEDPVGALCEVSDAVLEVAPRALTHAQISHHANKVLKHQSIKNTLGKDKRKGVRKENTKAWDKEKLKRKKEEGADGSKPKKKDKKEDAKDRDRFFTQLRKEKKTTRASKWAEVAKTAKLAKSKRKEVKAAWWKANGAKPKELREPIPAAAKFIPKAPAKPKFRWADKADKKQVSAALRNAAQRMQNTANLPARGDAFKISEGEAPYSGAHARKAVMNSYLNQNSPVGPQLMPKPFSNFAYSRTHPEVALRGKSPIPGTHPNLVEYPLTANGWTGHTKVGAARVITSSTGVAGAHNDRFFGVIGHDASRGGDSNDHYLAHHTVV
ncbi:hypothetical protein GALMADRAFT_1344338 [Galerina marginata CBS 339.88]|uniref:Uncharacterized protein n=1 Tax=Galerina marginata (strain CBS 339.88) TaxID=685588 RepID=A0A067SMH0_GALM3|nr:hypothetical protein GALMADRAFT_1344338 [Galerina marginata CBS 339.88]